MPVDGDGETRWKKGEHRRKKGEEGRRRKEEGRGDERENERAVSILAAMASKN